MATKGTASAILAVAAMGMLVSACSGGEPSAGNENIVSAPAPSSIAPPPAPTAEKRSPQDPILGVSDSSEGPPPECAPPVVQRKQHIPVAKFVFDGQSGDTFTIDVTKKDGATLTRTVEFEKGQDKAIVGTGVFNGNIKVVTVSAKGRVGTPGQCVITTIK